MEGLTIDTRLVREILLRFIYEETAKVGISKVILGLSGGVDSTVVAYLAVEALGPDNVIGICMPYKTSSKASLDDAKLVIENLGIKATTIEITPMVDAYFAAFPDADMLRRGNKMARERMTILYDQSAVHRALVIGTSNKTELLLGYGTLYGDTASAINPLGDLYKTQVFQLASALKVPQRIIEKKPSADLWENQTDEGELGFTYRDVDRLLYLLVDRRYRPEECLAYGFSSQFIDTVVKRMRSAQFKRKPPIIAKIAAHTVGHDFLYARDYVAAR